MGISTINALAWTANTHQYSWAVNPYEDISYRWSVYSDEFQNDWTLENASYIVDSTSIFNECGTLAKWMVDKGWRIDTVPNLKQSDGKFQDIQPGDILFFAEQMGISGMFKFYVADMFPGYNYRNITHAAIVTEVHYDDRIVGSPYPYNYFIKIISPPSILANYLKQTSGHFEYDPTMEYFLEATNVYTNTNNLSHYLPALDTLVLACRPNLTSHKKSYLEIEAEKLGLHTIPENKDQLEIIKKCRICSDIEWTPGLDYARPMPLTGSGDDYSLDIAYVQGQPIVNESYNNYIVNGVFKAGKTYKGMPWTVRFDSAYPFNTDKTSLCPQQFISIIESSNDSVVTYNYNDPNDDGMYPLYGWNQPLDLLRYVFDDKCNIILDEDSGQPLFTFQQGFFESILFDSNGDIIYSNDELCLEDLKLGSIIIYYNNDNQCRVYAAIVTDIIKNDLDEVVQVELTEATRYGLTDVTKLDGPDGNLIRRKFYDRYQLGIWLHQDVYSIRDKYVDIQSQRRK